MFQDPGCLGVCQKIMAGDFLKCNFSVPKNWCRNCSSSGRWTSSWNPAQGPGWNDIQTQSKQKVGNVKQVGGCRCFIPHPPCFRVFFPQESYHHLGLLPFLFGFAGNLVIPQIFHLSHPFPLGAFSHCLLSLPLAFKAWEAVTNCYGEPFCSTPTWYISTSWETDSDFSPIWKQKCSHTKGEKLTKIQPFTNDGNGYTDVLLLAFLLRFPVNLGESPRSIHVAKAHQSQENIWNCPQIPPKKKRTCPLKNRASENYILSLLKMVPFKKGKNIRNIRNDFSGEVNLTHPTLPLGSTLETASGKVMQPARCSQSLSVPLRMASHAEGKPQKIPPVKLGIKTGWTNSASWKDWIGIMGFFVPFFIMNVACWMFPSSLVICLKSFAGENLKYQKNRPNLPNLAPRKEAPHLWPLQLVRDSNPQKGETSWSFRNSPDEIHPFLQAS